MKNEILNLINCNNLSHIKIDSKNEVKDKVISGAKKIKNDYSLSPQIAANYSDYSKQDKESLKYAAKGIVFDIVDSLYFSAKEGEIQKNNLIRMNIRINREKEKQGQHNCLNY